jgi:hypothetical protein
MIYYHCDRCRKRQAPRNTACWNCGDVFARPVPTERPLVVVVDKETLEYSIYDGEGDINMAGIPPKRVVKQLRRAYFKDMRAHDKLPKGQARFGSDPLDWVAAGIASLCAIAGIILVTNPGFFMGH